MEKKYFSIMVVLFCTTFFATAQEYHYIPFPDSNAVWSEIYWKPITDPLPRWVYNQYALFNEDTLIDGNVYHKLYHTNASKITRENSKCIGGIREDSAKRVYLYPDSYYRLLFDFSLNEKDTFWTYGKYNNCICNFLTVENIDTIRVKNHSRKVFYFKESPLIIWIEGIGNVQGLQWCVTDWPSNGIGNELVCMHQNDTLLYFNSGMFYATFDDCVPQFVKDGVALLPNTEVKVYPNPATGGLVNFENLDFETLELYDLSGKLLRKEGISGVDCYQLDVSNLPPGVYTYRLKTNGLVPTMGKIVVQSYY
jgi:hypothetical protein